MYDMYPWNQPPADRGPAGRSAARPGAGRRAARLPRTVRAVSAAPATRALQMALDRRDNGGQSAAAAGQ